MSASGHNVEATVYHRLPLDVSRRRSGRAAAGRRDRVRQRRRGHERERRLRPDARLRRHRRLCRLAPRRAGPRRCCEAQIEAGNGRFRGIRYATGWDDERGDPPHPHQSAAWPDAAMRPGARASRSLARSASPSTPGFIIRRFGELATLRGAFPTPRSCSTMSAVRSAIGPYAGRHDEVFRDWKTSMAATRPPPQRRP